MRMSLSEKRIVAWILVLVMVLGVLPLEQFAGDVYAGDTVELTVKMDWQDYGFTGPKPDIIDAALKTVSGDLIADDIILSADSGWEATYSIDAYLYETGDYVWSIGDVNRYGTSDPVTEDQETVFTAVPVSLSRQVGVEKVSFNNEPDQYVFSLSELAVGLGDRYMIPESSAQVYDVESSDPEVLKVSRVKMLGSYSWFLLPQKAGEVTVTACEDENRTSTAELNVIVMEQDNVYTVFDRSSNASISFDDETQTCKLTGIDSTDAIDVANVYVPGKIYHLNSTDYTNQYYDVVLGSSEALENPAANKIKIYDAENIIFGEGVRADKNMDYVFSEAQVLTDIDLSNVDFSQTESMAGMFSDSTMLSKVNFGKKTISNVSDMTGMFSGCTSLEKIDLGCFYTASLKKMSNMFDGCTALAKIKAGTGFVTDSVTDGDDVFKGCTVLVGGEGTEYSADNTGYTYAKIDGGNTDPGYFTGDETIELKAKAEWLDYGFEDERPERLYATLYMDDVVYRENLEMTQANDWEAGIIIDASDLKNKDYEWYVMPEGSKHMASEPVVNGYVSTFTVMPYNEALYDRVGTLNFVGGSTEYVFETPEIAIGRCDYYEVANLGSEDHVYDLVSSDPEVVKTVKIDTRDGDSWGLAPTGTGKATITAYDDADHTHSATLDVTVYGYGNIYNINPDNISATDVDDVTYIREIYLMGDYPVQYIPSRFLSNVGESSEEYKYLEVRLGSDDPGLDVGSNTSLDNDPLEHLICADGIKAGKDMSKVFSESDSLKSVDITGVDFSATENMSSMFAGSTALEEVEFPEEPITNVTDTSDMFSGCSEIIFADIASFETKKLTKMSSMFKDCGKLRTIYATRKFVTTAVTEGDDVFSGCTSLHGSKGTEYDAQNVDYKYARIDNGFGAPGYFTRYYSDGERVKELSYSFENSYAGMKNKPGYEIPVQRYTSLFKNKGSYMYSIFSDEWGGNCYGAATTSSLLDYENNDINVTDYDENADDISDLEMPEADDDPTDDKRSELFRDLRKFMEAMQISQFDERVQYCFYFNKGIDAVCKALKDEQNKHPMIIGLFGPEGGHAVLAYELEDSQPKSFEYDAKIHVYDSNHPNEDCVINVVKRGGEYIDWTYYVGEMSDHTQIRWGTIDENGEPLSYADKCKIIYVPYYIYKAPLYDGGDFDADDWFASDDDEWTDEDEDDYQLSKDDWTESDERVYKLYPWTEAEEADYKNWDVAADDDDSQPDWKADEEEAYQKALEQGGEWDYSQETDSDYDSWGASDEDDYQEWVRSGYDPAKFNVRIRMRFKMRIRMRIRMRTMLVDSDYYTVKDENGQDVAVVRDGEVTPGSDYDDGEVFGSTDTGIFTGDKNIESNGKKPIFVPIIDQTITNNDADKDLSLKLMDEDRAVAIRTDADSAKVAFDETGAARFEIPLKENESFEIDLSRGLDSDDKKDIEEIKISGNGIGKNAIISVAEDGTVTTENTKESEKSEDDQNLALNETDITMKPGSTFKLQLSGADDEDLAGAEWSSSDETVAVIDNTGLIKAQWKAGTALIKAVVKDKGEVTCKVTVADPAGPSKADLSKYTAPEGTLAARSVKLKKFLFADAKGAKDFRISEGAKSTVNKKGVLEIKATESFKVEALDKDGKVIGQKSVSVCKADVKVKELTLDYMGRADLNEYVDSTVRPSGWKATRKAVAEISEDGLLTVKKPGKSKVTVTFGEKGQKLNKFVINIAVNCPGFKKKSYKLKKGASLEIKDILLNIPGDAHVTYSSDDGGKTVTVDPSTGKVTGVEAGTATVTATVNGIPYTTQIRVK